MGIETGMFLANALCVGAISFSAKALEALYTGAAFAAHISNTLL